MSQYLRIVSYLYQYQNNVRGKNVGFIKAERRDGMCRFQLQVPKYPETADYSDCPVFFYGYRDFEPCLFPLTTVSMRNSQLSFRFAKPEQEIFDGATTLEAMEGILIVLSENTYLSSTWKELDGNDFFQLLHTELSRTSPPALPSTKPLSLTKAAATADSEPHSTNKASAAADNEAAAAADSEPYSSNKAAAAADNEAAATADSELHSSNKVAATADSELHSTEIQDKERNENNELPKAENDNHEASDFSKTPDLSADMGASIFYNQRKQPADTLDSQATKNQSQSRQEDCRVTPDTIFSAYPKLPAFQSCNSCIRIEPQDIGILPMKHWGLAGNSFLLHGYYCFHHLLLARCDDDRYLLGVPGFYHPNEKIMAAMFGFDSFGTINQNPRQSGDFGYFYRMIE